MSDVTIKIKRSLTPGNVPTDLELGELAVNIPDKKIYIGDNSTDNIALIVDGNAIGSGTPAGNNTEIQFNNNGEFGSSDELTIEEGARTFLQLKNRSGIKFFESSTNGTNNISFIAPSSLTSNYNPYVLPEPTNTINSYLALTSTSQGVYTLNWVKAIVADFEGTINNVTLTQPATAATLTIANNKIFTVNNTLSFIGTDSASIDFGAGGTVAYTSNKLNVFSSTTSSELASIISDKTGTNSLVFANNPTLTGNVHITGNLIVSGYIETDTGILGSTDSEQEFLGTGMVLDGGSYD